MTDYIYLTKLICSTPDVKFSETDEQALSEHFEYLTSLLRESKLHIAGSCTDYAFGVIIFKAESLAEAENIMNNDPAIKRKIMTGELHEFRISLKAI